MLRACLANKKWSLNFRHSSLKFSHPFAFIIQLLSLNIFYTIHEPHNCYCVRPLLFCYPRTIFIPISISLFLISPSPSALSLPKQKPKPRKMSQPPSPRQYHHHRWTTPKHWSKTITTVSINQLKCLPKHQTKKKKKKKLQTHNHWSKLITTVSKFK